MQAKPLATNLGEQANKIAVSVQSGDGDVLALWGMCRRYAMQQATRWLRAFESSGGVELDDLEQSAFIVTPGVGTVVGMGLGLILGLSIYSVRKDPKKGTQRLVSIGRSVLLGLLAGVLGVGLAALGIVSAGTAFIISAAIGLALKFFVDSVDDSKVRKATSGFTGTRVSTKAPTRRRRVAAQSLDGNAPVYNDIPQLAHGAVIPPNKEFLAVLGDQKSGTNIETPLATMVDAFKQAMAESGGGATTVVIQLDGKEIARSTVKNINNMTRAAGKPVLLY